MTLDFHYQSASIVKYRTDVTFGWLDLMVSFGGIAGLFLGCSLLSGVEIVYYFIIISLLLSKKLYKRVETFSNSHSAELKVSDNQENRKKIKNNPGGDIKIIKVQSLSDVDDNFKSKIKNDGKSRF